MNFSLQGSPFNSSENENDNEIERKKQQRAKNKTLRRPINNGRLNENNGLPVNAGSMGNGSRAARNKNVENMIGSIHSQAGMEEENPLADFYPPPHAEIQKRGAQVTKGIEKANMEELDPIDPNYHVTSIDEGGENLAGVHTVDVDGPVTKEGFNSLPTNFYNNNSPNTYGTANAYGDGHNAYGDSNNNIAYGNNTYTGQNNYVGPYKQKIPYYTQMSKPTVETKDPLLEKLNYMILLLEEQKDEKTGHVMEELILYSFLGVFLIFIVDSFARAGKYTR